MSLADDVNIEEFVNAKDELSGADIKAICTESGLLALRERRMKVTQEDFRKAKEKTLHLKKGNIPEMLYLWETNNCNISFLIVLFWKINSGMYHKIVLAKILFW